MRTAPTVRLHSDERRQLVDLARSGWTNPRVALRAAIVLRAAEGADNRRIAQELRTTAPTVSRWRRRFIAHGIGGINRDAPRPGRPHAISEAIVDRVIRTTLRKVPTELAHWSARSLAREVGVSKSTVQRIWRAHGIRSRRPETAGDDDAGLAFLERVTDLVGLYLDPPARAVAFSTDERKSPNPFRLRDASVERTTPRRIPGAQLRAFLQMTERETPEVLDVHLLVDSRVAPVSAEVRRWLSRHPRFHLHFLPADETGQSPIDRMIDGFSRRKDRPGASASARRLKYALREHIRQDRGSARPFVWTAALGDIRGAHGRRAIRQ